jgi:hypothetical protein
MKLPISLLSDHHLLSFSLCSDSTFVQSHHIHSVCSCHLGLGSWAGRALRTDLRTRMMGSGIACR